jgi:hypothetical protein
MKSHPYLPRVVIFVKIGFAICVLVGLGCRHFIISFPSLQVDFQRQRRKKKNSAFLKRRRFRLGWPFSIWSLNFRNSLNRPPGKTMIRPQDLGAFFKTVLDFNFKSI